MSHRILAAVSLESLNGALNSIFENVSVKSSPELVEPVKTARFFLEQVRGELAEFVKEYDVLKAMVYPLEDDER